MNRVDECLDRLIAEILASQEYRQYREIREKVACEPEKEKSINNFRRRNFLLQRSKDNMDLFEEIDKLEQEFLKFRQEPLVEEYLSAELALCRMIQKINRQLMERLDFDTEFLNQ